MLRWIVRLFLLVLTLLGVLLALVYPWAVDNVDGHQIGSWRVYDGAGEYQPFEPAIAPSEAPVRLYVYMTIEGRFQPERPRPVLSITVTADGTTIIARPIAFVEYPAIEESPQSSQAVYGDYAGTIDPADADDYVVTVTPQDVDGLDIRSVEVLLLARAFQRDPTVAPIGYAMLALGLVGLVLSFRRRRPTKPAGDEPPRWGRG